MILAIDPEFDKNYLGQKAIRNAFYYNESTDELLVSFRGIDAIVSYNFKGNTLNWVFTNPNNELFQRDVWKNYLVTTKSNRYPLGQHSVFITQDGNIGIFNNGYDRLYGFENGGNDQVSSYATNYSSVDIYKINGRQANLVWQYDANKALFSHQYGSVRETNYGYLMNFGYNLKDEYRNNALGLLSEAEANQDNIYAKIIEVDKNKNVLFEAISEEGKFRVFKNSMYKSVTSNPVISQLNIFENLEEDTLNEITYKEVDIENSSEWIYETNFTKNTFDTNYEILDSDELKLYFVNRNGKIYILDYKKKDSVNNKRIFNVNLPKDEYALYINLNDKIYKTNNVYKF